MLQVGPLKEEVTVAAARDSVDTLRLAAQPVAVISADEIATRVKTVVAQAVEGEAGVHLQQTSPTMAGIFVRGLTGNKVNVFVDGVRYSNGAQRGGVNTFLDLIDPGRTRADRDPPRAVERPVRQRRARRQRPVLLEASRRRSPGGASLAAAPSASPAAPAIAMAPAPQSSGTPGRRSASPAR